MNFWVDTSLSTVLLNFLLQVSQRIHACVYMLCPGMNIWYSHMYVPVAYMNPILNGSSAIKRCELSASYTWNMWMTEIYSVSVSDCQSYTYIIYYTYIHTYIHIHGDLWTLTPHLWDVHDRVVLGPWEEAGHKVGLDVPIGEPAPGHVSSQLV